MNPPIVRTPEAAPAVEHLRTLARHNDADVRAWALRRLVATNPAAGFEAAAEGLRDQDEEVRGEAIDLLAQIPGEASRRALSDALKSRKIRPEWIRIKAIKALGAVGGRDARPDLERLAALGSDAERAAAWRAIHLIDPDRAVSAVRAEWRRRASEPWFDLMIDIGRPQDAGELIEALHGGRDREQAGALMHAILEGAGCEDAFPWGSTWDPGLLKDRFDRKYEGDRAERDGLPVDDWLRVLDRLYTRDWPRVVEGALEIAGRPPESAVPEIAACRRATASALRERSGWNEIDAWIAMALAIGSHRSRSIDAALASGARAVDLAPLAGTASAAYDAELSRRIAAGWELERGSNLSALRSALQDPNRALGAARALAVVPDPSVGGLYLEAIDGELGDDVLEVIVEWFVGHPVELKAAAAALDPDGGMRTGIVLEALKECGSSWAADAVLANLDRLLGSTNRWEALAVLRNSGNGAAVDALIREWRPGERELAHVLDFVARVADRREALTEEMKRDAALGEMPDLHSLDPQTVWEHLAAKGFTFPLKCTRCARIGEYRVRRIFIDSDKSAGPERTILCRVIVCKYCGAEDEYALTASAQMSILASTILVVGRKEPLDVDDPVCIGTPALKDGFRYRRPSEAIRHLREGTRERPDDADAWLRLGNFLKRHEQSKEAREAYLKAESLDGKNVEVLFNLMTDLLEEGRPDESWDYLRRGIESIPNASRALRKKVVDPLVEHLEHAVQAIRQPMWLHAVWMGESNISGRDMATLSAVDLRRLRRWDRLSEFLEGTELKALTFAQDGPPDRPTILEKRLEGGGVRGEPNVVMYEVGGNSRLKPAGGVSRNAPCPCGSDRKYKRCCGKK